MPLSSSIVASRGSSLNTLNNQTHTHAHTHHVYIPNRFAHIRELAGNTSVTQCIISVAYFLITLRSSTTEILYTDISTYARRLGADHWITFVCVRASVERVCVCACICISNTWENWFTRMRDIERIAPHLPYCITCWSRPLWSQILHVRLLFAAHRRNRSTPSTSPSDEWIYS